MTFETELAPRTLSRLKILQAIITDYDGLQPFHHYLQNVFKANKAFGSTDRRIYRTWSYAWFRIGNTLSHLDFEQRIFIASFLVNGIHDQLSKDLAKKYINVDSTKLINSTVGSRISEIKQKYPDFDIENIVNQLPEFSDAVTAHNYTLAMLQQPNVFIRINHHFIESIKQELTNQSIPFTAYAEPNNCIAVAPGTNLDILPSAGKKRFEIQDKSSQIVAMKIPAAENETVWDCCCGAGGKSLALIDRIKNFDLIATDKRSSVLENFQKRLPNDHNQNIKLMQVDLNDALPEELNSVLFDGIIADVPCSGSGTWARSPENLSNFKSDSLQDFQKKQQYIIEKTLPLLKPGGWLIYITCSVFKGENEEIVDWAAKNMQLDLIETQLIEGFSTHCDSMFYAIFRK